MKLTLYIIKRILLMLLTVFAIFSVCFAVIKSLPMPAPTGSAEQVRAELEVREALGYGKPLIKQYGIYLKNIFLDGFWGVSRKVDKLVPVTQVLFSRLPYTVIINLYSLAFSLPIGIFLGIVAALKHNKWQDRVISVAVMLFISVPSYVYAFLLQYFLYFKLGIFEANVFSLAEAGERMGLSQERVSKMLASGNVLSIYLSLPMLYSMALPIISLSFLTVASLARFVRAELIEVMQSDYMLLARAKGLSKPDAVIRHGLRNAAVPILPMLLGEVAAVLSGSVIIEQIFGVPGVGNLYISSIKLLDYDLFLFISVFYALIGLGASLLADISYGFADPRIRMGEA